MDFSAFLSSATTTEFWQGRTTFCFVGTTYPMLWFRMLFENLQHKHLLPYPVQYLHFDATEKKALHATLSQSMLGDFSFFWLGNINAEKETKASLEASAFLFSYRGPHAIAFFTTQQPKNLPTASIVVQLPSAVDNKHLVELASFFGINLDDKKKTLLKSIIPTSTTCDLETICMLLTYIELINPKYAEEYKNFLTNLIGTSPSLSALSEHFFAKNSRSFFQLWSSTRTQYPDVFWIVFWSEQIWKAHHVGAYLKEKNFVAAKRIGSRLPYSFMNRDWQKSNAKELAQAYEFLYHMDYALKTGSTFCSLDLFYMKYFTGTFA